MKEIVEKSGIARGSFYQYFEKVEDAIFTIVTDFLSRKGCINGFKVVYLRGRLLVGGSYGKRDYLYYGNSGSRNY